MTVRKYEETVREVKQMIDFEGKDGKIGGSRRMAKASVGSTRPLTTITKGTRAMANANSIRTRLKKQSHIDGEIWKDVTGYDGVYQVSDLGRVRRVRTGLVLSPGYDKKTGYANVGLCVNGVVERYRLHHLVADAFLGKRPDGFEVNHIDNNPSNNRLDNLEYLTRKENIQHAVSQGRMGGNNISIEQVERITDLLKKRHPRLSYGEIGELVGVSRDTVRNISKASSTWVLLSVVSQPHPEHRSSRLSEKDITEIAELLAESDLTGREIAKIYNVDDSTISRIKRGEYHERFTTPILRKKFPDHKTGRYRLLSDAQVNEILNSTDSKPSLARKYGVSKGTINRIFRGVYTKGLSK